MIKKILPLVLFTFFTATTMAQSVSVNNSGATADGSSILDVSSTSKGVLVPRMSKAQKNAIPSPANALMVYQTSPDSVGFHYYDAPNTRWVYVNASGFANDTSAWKITGNSNITSANFLGTTNDTALNFRVRNQKSGTIDSINLNTSFGYGTLRNLNFAGGLAGKTNSAFGYRTLDSNTTGFYNNAFGYNSMLSNKNGWDNSAFGNEAMKANTSGAGNSAFGAGTLFLNTTGNQNTAVGWVSGFNNTEAWYNTSVGASSFTQNKTSVGNTAVGSYSLEAHVTNPYNTAIGHEALRYDTSGWLNTAVGWRSMWKRLRGSENTAIGVGSLENDTAGNYNVAVGRYAGFGLKKGDGNIFIGFQSGGSADSSVNATFIGRDAGYYNRSNYNTGLGAYAMTYNNNTGNPLTQGIENTGIGYGALFTNEIGSKNVALGYQAMNGIFAFGSGPSRNVAIGDSAAMNLNNGSSNVAIGSQAGRFMSSAVGNVIIGDSTFINATTSRYNTGIGYKSLQKTNIAASNSPNTALGAFTLENNTTGQGNIAIGYEAINSNTFGSRSVAIGNFAMGNATTISNSVAIGDSAMALSGNTFGLNTNFASIAIGPKSLKNSGYNNTTKFALNNIAIGAKALENDSTGAYNIAIGNNAMVSKQSGSNNIAIGDSAMGLSVYTNITSNNIAIGYKALKKSGYNGTTKFAVSNTAIGNTALENDSSGTSNVAIGFLALNRSKNSSNSVAIGVGAGYYQEGQGGVGNNVWIGSEAGSGLFSNTSTGTNNAAVGYRALKQNFTGDKNVALGAEASFVNTNGSNNVAIGYYASRGNANGSRNIAVGSQSLALNQDSNNVAIGNNAISRNNNGTGNIGIGSEVLTNLTSGDDYNTVIGDSAMQGNTIGGRNVIIGAKALKSGGGNFDNVIIGYNAMISNNTGGDDNTAVGANSLQNASNSGNTALGKNAGDNIGNGSNNTLIGFDTDTDPGLSNATAIGYKALTSSSNSLVLGSINGVNGAIANTNVGMGTTTPDARLHIVRNGASGGTYHPAASTIIEDNADSYVQFSNPTINETGLLSGNTVTNIRSALIFRQDSSIRLRSGGNIERLIIDKNGYAAFNKNPPLNGIDVGTLQVQSTNAGDDIFGIYGSTGTNRWTYYTTTGDLFMYNNGVTRGSWSAINGVYTSFSDLRLKKDISELPVGALAKINQLKTYSFRYKDNKSTDPLTIGFMAQEVQPFFPEAVTQITNKDGSTSLGLKYQYFGVYAIKAIQEQQTQIEELKKQNELLMKRLEKLENNNR
jgi:hypothetical protein